MADLVGQTVAGYPIEKPLDKGAYGILYEARTSAQPVAILVLRENLRGDAALCDAVASGWEEARQVVHPNLLSIFAAGRDPQHGPYCIVELGKTRTLRKIVYEGMSLAWRDGLEILGQVVTGLKALHEAGVTHGCLWPSGIQITLDQDVKLEAPGALHGVARPVAEVVEPGALGYLAPERLAGAPSTPGTDLYSAGACLYFLFTSRDPFPGRDAASVVSAAMTQDPPDIGGLSEAVPPEGQTFLKRLLAKDPTQRYAHAADVLADIVELRAGRPLGPLKGGAPANIPAQAAVISSPPDLDATIVNPAAAQAALRATPQAPSEPVPPGVRERPTGSFGSGELSTADVRPSGIREPASRGERSGLRAAVAGGSHAVLSAMAGGTMVFGKLETQVNSTIPQSDIERGGDDLFRKGHLAQALEAWLRARDSGHDYAGLRAKIELGQRDVRRQQFDTAMNEARFSMDTAQFGDAAARAQEAVNLADTPDLRQDALKIVQLAKAKGEEQQRQENRRKLMFVGAVIVLLAIVAAALGIKILTR